MKLWIVPNNCSLFQLFQNAFLAELIHTLAFCIIQNIRSCRNSFTFSWETTVKKILQDKRREQRKWNLTFISFAFEADGAAFLYTNCLSTIWLLTASQVWVSFDHLRKRESQLQSLIPGVLFFRRVGVCFCGIALWQLVSICWMAPCTLGFTWL